MVFLSALIPTIFNQIWILYAWDSKTAVATILILFHTAIYQIDANFIINKCYVPMKYISLNHNYSTETSDQSV